MTNASGSLESAVLHLHTSLHLRVEIVAQAVADDIHGKDRHREKDVGEENCSQRNGEQRAALGDEVTATRNLGRCSGAEEAQIGFRNDPLTGRHIDRRTAPFDVAHA